ncbi:MAG: hypothetical protein GWO16_12210 [Gammaproteobacteria bacterium]|nr:hypothetical protein [Gammaproteobacteria bacterium]
MNILPKHPVAGYPQSRTRIGWAALLAVSTWVLGTAPALASSDDRHDGDARGRKDICTQTAGLVLKACGSEAADNFLIATANCINLGDRDERRSCGEEAQEERSDARELCQEQFDARLEICDLLGEGAYDPDFEPDHFDLGGNRYFPLAVGNVWVYESTYEDEDGEEITETITVRVLENEESPGTHATKEIDGVTCLVVNDLVAEDGEVIENTDDWYAHNVFTGDIWYCGELSREFETFEADQPPLPELVSIDGSFKAGRDGDRPGILVRAAPQVAEAYRQEFSLGNAEDVAQVLSTTYVFGGETDDPESLDYRVPQELANRFCSAKSPCLVTMDLTALEPDVRERKYWAQDIGVFLEVNLTDDETVELIECNFHGNCPPAAP